MPAVVAVVSEYILREAVTERPVLPGDGTARPQVGWGPTDRQATRFSSLSLPFGPTGDKNAAEVRHAGMPED